MLSRRLAGLGAVSGAVTAAIGVVCGDDHMLDAFHVAPGVAFGVIIGTALWRGGQLAGKRWLAYVAAATLANALSVLLALRTVEPAIRLVGNERAAVALIGLVAGALGGGLLGLASQWLVGARRFTIARWRWAAGAGAALGLLLPVLVEGEALGALAFYVLWQAGYAAITPAITAGEGDMSRA
jgi:hypothetical protein